MLPFNRILTQTIDCNCGVIPTHYKYIYIWCFADRALYVVYQYNETNVIHF
jgi:hypothetical protein